MERSYFNEIANRAFMAADRVNNYADKKDVNRNHVNYGAVGAWLQVMEDMGHKTDLPVWEDDNGCLRIPYLKIDEVRLMEFANGK